MNLTKKLVSLVSLILAVILLLGLLASVFTVPANAADKLSSSEIREQIKEMERQQAETQKKIKELEDQLSDNLSEMAAIVEQKNIVDQEIYLLHDQIANTNNMIAAYNVLIADKQAELARAEEKLAQLNEQNKERIRAMEEDGPLSYWTVLFKASSFSDLLDRLNMVQEIAAADQRLLKEMQETAEAVATAQAELVTEKANLELVREELASAEATLQAKRDETDELLKQLIAIGEEYEAYLEEQEVYQQDLAQQIAQKREDLEDAKESEYWATYVPPTTTQPPPPTTKPYEPPKPEDDPPVSDSGWRSPMTRKTWVTSPFGMRFHPVHKEWRMHNGVDLEGDTGDDIVAARSGTVIKAAYHKSMGNYVTIDHGDGYTSIYMHMTHDVVSVGDWVNAGEKIGECGSTGVSTGAHLHFGIYYNGKAVNPMKFIKVR